MDLNTGANSGGTQASTQSPQSGVTSGGLSGTNASSIQPGTAGSDINTSQSSGLSLTPTSLSTVNLNNLKTSTSSPTVTATPITRSNHHINTAFLAVALVLLVFAVGMTIQITRSAKITTE